MRPISLTVIIALMFLKANVVFASTWTLSYTGSPMSSGTAFVGDSIDASVTLSCSTLCPSTLLYTGGVSDGISSYALSLVSSSGQTLYSVNSANGGDQTGVFLRFNPSGTTVADWELQLRPTDGISPSLLFTSGLPDFEPSCAQGGNCYQSGVNGVSGGFAFSDSITPAGSWAAVPSGVAVTPIPSAILFYATGLIALALYFMFKSIACRSVGQRNWRFA